MDLDSLNETWGIPGAIEFGTGQGDLPTVLLTHPQTGMQLVVYLYGATIAQWLKSDGTATFYDGPDGLYDPGLPLRTGVSLHFPQHREGLLPEHGFADSMMWEVVGAGFDCPEVLGQLQTYWETLQAKGSVTPEMLDEAEQGGEAAEAVQAALMAEPLPDSMVSTDLAPSVTLRLRDTAETRSMWPHKFELEYKITLMLQDLTQEDLREMRVIEGLDPDEPSDEDEEEEEDGEGEQGEVAMAGEDGEEPQGVEASGTPSKGRRRSQRDDPADGGADAGDSEDDAEYGDDAPEPEAGTVTDEGFVPAVQIKQEFWVRNMDEPGSPAMRFNLASLARFTTLQQPECSAWVKVLGLGGSQTFDYTADPRYPAMDLNEEDYLHFRGEPVDVTYIGAADATVYLCPGNRTHFEFIQRSGFRDMFVQQPGLGAAPQCDRMAAVGTGYIASTKKLAAGNEWYAESIIRFHPRYWRQPIFGDDSMPPIPPIPLELLAEAEGEEGGGADAYDGLPSDPQGQAPDREQ